MKMPKNLNLIVLVRESPYLPWRQKPKQRAYFTLGASLFFVAFFGFLAVNPAVQTILATRKEVADLRQKETAIDERVSTLVSLQNQLETTTNEQAILEAALPLSADPVAVAEEFENLAARVSAQITSMQLGALHLAPMVMSDRTTKVYLTEVPITMGVSGDFSAVRQMLSGLEHLPQMVQVDEAVLDMRSAKELETTLKLRTYFLTDQPSRKVGVAGQ